MKPLRAAVIGVGYLGRFHAAKLAGCAGVELAAVVDADFGRAREVAAVHGCAAFSDHREVLASVDLVSIAVPTVAHFDVARACFEAGVHALIEKPITRTLEEAEALIEIARRRACLLQVGHLERFSPAFRAFAATLERPLFIDSERLGGFKQRGADVDVVLDLMIHDLDLILSIAKSEVSEVSACGFRVITDSVDIANARIEFSDGCVANVSASRVSRDPVRKLRVFQADQYSSVDLHASSLRTVRRAADAAQVVESGSEFPNPDPLRAEIESFVEAVRAGREPVVTGEDGMRALALALKVGALVAERTARYPPNERQAAELKA